MRKVRIILIFIGSILVLFETANFYNVFRNNSNAYGDYKISATIPIDDKINTEAEMTEIIRIADKHHVLLESVLYGDDGIIYFISFESMLDLESSLASDISDKEECLEEVCYLSTREIVYSDAQQVGIIKDFMNDTIVDTFLLKDIFKTDIKLSSFLSVLDNDLNAANTKPFINEVAGLLDIVPNEIEVYQSSSFGIGTILPFIDGKYEAIVILMVLICALEVYGLFSKSKKIAILELCGLSKKGIYRELIFKKIKWMIILHVAMLICSPFIIPNITLEYMAILASLLALMTLLIVLTNYLALRRFLTIYSRIDILLKLANTKKILFSVNMVIKCAVVALTLLFSSQIATNLEGIYQKYKLIEPFAKYSDYGFFYGVYNDLFYTAETQQAKREMYEEFSKDEDFSVMYASFTYSEGAPVDVNKYVTPEYTYYRISIVDNNYVNSQSLIDEKGERIEFDKSAEMVVLIPTSDKTSTESIINQLIESLGYPNSEQLGPYKIVYYQDQWVEVMRYGLSENGLVQGPVMLMFSESSLREHFDITTKMYNIGFGYDTALKIKANKANNSVETYKLVKEKMDEIGLGNLTNKNGFMTNSEIIAQETYSLRYNLRALVIQFISSLIVLIVTVYQSVSIYVDNHRKKLAVRYSLGYQVYHQSKGLLKQNLYIDILGCCLAFVLIKFGTENVSMIWYIGLSLIYIVIDYLASYLTLRNLLSKNIVTLLKGEES